MKQTEKDNALIVIAGPTAVGKTSIAIKLAGHFNSEIFSADSRQIYREMNIGTAKPDLQELEEVSHHFINHKSIHEPYNAGFFEKEVLASLKSYYQKNDIAILTGGTGLYIKAVVDGLDKFPDIPKNVVEQVTLDLQQNGIENLQRELKESDYDYFQHADIQNPHRLIRAISVIRSSGKPFSSFFNQERKPRSFKAVLIFLELERNQLYERINTRVDKMMAMGLLNEAERLYPFRHLQSLQTVGYQELFDYIDGKCSLDEAVTAIKQNSRRYAKRQMTWFRKDKRWTSFKPDSLTDIIRFIDKQLNPADPK